MSFLSYKVAESYHSSVLPALCTDLSLCCAERGEDGKVGIQYYNRFESAQQGAPVREQCIIVMQYLIISKHEVSSRARREEVTKLDRYCCS